MNNEGSVLKPNRVAGGRTGGGSPASDRQAHYGFGRFERLPPPSLRFDRRSLTVHVLWFPCFERGMQLCQKSELGRPTAMGLPSCFESRSQTKLLERTVRIRRQRLLIEVRETGAL